MNIFPGFHSLHEQNFDDDVVRIRIPRRAAGDAKRRTSRVLDREQDPGDDNMDVMTDIMQEPSLIMQEHSNHIMFLMQRTLVKRPRSHRTSIEIPCSWRIARMFFPGMKWRNNKRCHDKGHLALTIKPEQDGDASDELVAALRATNDAFLRRFYTHNTSKCEDGEECREHNCAHVVLNQPKLPMHVSWMNRNATQTLPDLKEASINCGFLRLSHGISTGKEEETGEDCLPGGDKHFEELDEPGMEKMMELEADNERLRCKCKALMSLVIKLGGSFKMINKAVSKETKKFHALFGTAHDRARARGSQS